MTRLAVRRWLALLSVVWLCAPRAAHADEGRILLVSVPAAEGGWPPAEKRALAELAAIGLDVQWANAPELTECSDDEATRAAIRAAGALGALELRLQGGKRRELRVCVVELVTGKATLRHLEIASDLPPAQAALLAVELVHASLLEVRAPHPSRGQVRAPARVKSSVDQQLAPPRVPWLGLRFGAGVLGGPGGVSPSVAPTAGVAILPLPRLALEADGALGVLAGTASRADGKAEVRLGLGRLHAFYALRASGRVRVALGLGAGVAVASVTGQASSPFRSSSGVATTGFVSGALSSTLALSTSWRVRLDSHLGWSPAPVRVTFVSQPPAELGRPLLDAALAVEWLALH